MKCRMPAHSVTRDTLDAIGKKILSKCGGGSEQNLHFGAVEFDVLYA